MDTLEFLITPSYPFFFFYWNCIVLLDYFFAYLEFFFYIQNFQQLWKMLFNANNSSLNSIQIWNIFQICRIKIQRKQIEFRKGRLFRRYEKKKRRRREKKNRILSAPTKIYFPFERFNSLLFPLSPLCPLTLPLLPWKTQFLASVKSQRTIENAHDQSIYFLVYFRITKVRGRNLRGIFMAWRTIHQVIKPDESFSFNIEHYPRTQIKIVARRILKL